VAAEEEGQYPTQVEQERDHRAEIVDRIRADRSTTCAPAGFWRRTTLTGETATYRFLVRNHSPAAIGPMDLSVGLPAGARLSHCWLGVEGPGRCSADGSRLTWTLPKLSGGKATGGPFGVVIDVSTLKPGRFEVTAWIDQPTVQLATTRQEVWLEKK
jgi:hypothetical protein